MSPKNKSRPAAPVANTVTLKPLFLRDVSGRPLPAAVGSRRPVVATHATGLANHAAHHVSRHTQS
jgi:hypothetical protein